MLRTILLLLTCACLPKDTTTEPAATEGERVDPPAEETTSEETTSEETTAAEFGDICCTCECTSGAEKFKTRDTLSDVNLGLKDEMCVTWCEKKNNDTQACVAVQAVTGACI